VTYARIDEQDWAEAWKAYFWPEKITDLIVVKPSWREYPAEPQEIVLEIDPGMAFGTGTHPTTSLCIRMIQTHLKPGDAFLDVGTGSGILMIAAAKLGAGTVCGVDNDEVAVTVAEKNLLANHIDRFVSPPLTSWTGCVKPSMWWQPTSLPRSSWNCCRT
jgi:ribosomal protein L11 methyltransferase